jgi:hypothetical protein
MNGLVVSSSGCLIKSCKLLKFQRINTLIHNRVPRLDTRYIKPNSWHRFNLNSQKNRVDLNFNVINTLIHNRVPRLDTRCYKPST